MRGSHPGEPPGRCTARAHVGVGDYLALSSCSKRSWRAGRARRRGPGVPGVSRSPTWGGTPRRGVARAIRRPGRRLAARRGSRSPAGPRAAARRHIDPARDAYERGLAAAERAGDAGMLATLQLNLAGLLKVGGDIAGAIEHFEAAVDMGGARAVA